MDCHPTDGNDDPMDHGDGRDGSHGRREEREGHAPIHAQYAGLDDDRRTAKILSLKKRWTKNSVLKP